MNDQFQQLVEKLTHAQNVLVTVSKNPSVDQLAAAIGLTAGLNNFGKHATAVYSGETPETIEFLRPEQTLEKNTDSLRDFIIALDKAKADKLRYKVEDDVVRIYVTPFRTSISEKDLNFSQGDFNVEVVIALDVKEQADLDEAIRAHGRIFHNATVISVATGEVSELGAINWADSSASSLSEMVADLLGKLDSKSIDSQVATALLTGIVSKTERFSNDKTSPRTMSTSAALMAAGANQQLVSAQLAPQVSEPEETPRTEEPETDVQDPQLKAEESVAQSEVSQPTKEKHEDTSVNESEDQRIDHSEPNALEEDKIAEIAVDEEGHLRLASEVEAEQNSQTPTEELKLPQLEEEVPMSPSTPPEQFAENTPQPAVLEPQAPQFAQPQQTISELEQQVGASQPPVPGTELQEVKAPESEPTHDPVRALDQARDAVAQALQGDTPAASPVEQSSNTLHHTEPVFNVPPPPSYLGTLPPVPPLPSVPDAPLQPAPAGFVSPSPTAPPPPPPMGSVPPLPTPPPEAPPLAPSIVPPVPSGNMVTSPVPPIPPAQPLPPAPGPQNGTPGMTPPPVPPPVLPPR